MNFSALQSFPKASFPGVLVKYESEKKLSERGRKGDGRKKEKRCLSQQGCEKKKKRLLGPILDILTNSRGIYLDRWNALPSHFVAHLAQKKAARYLPTSPSCE